MYIAGPMRGRLDYNFPAFMHADAVLKKEGWETINPAEMDNNDGFDTNRCIEDITQQELKDFIIRDIHLIMTADAICLLDGYQSSKGVAVELAVAQYCGLPVYYMDNQGSITR